MKDFCRFSPLALIFLCFYSIHCTAAAPVTFSEDEKKPVKKSKFQAGLYLGTYFANKYTAALYDGYGYDAEGKKNNFINSFMYRRLVLEMGGQSGQTDQVALALGVNPGEWSFDETDMPLNMRYNPAVSVGAHLSFFVSKKDALLLNLNASKLTLSGNFTIVITTPPIGPQPPGYQNIQTFSITGGEQRLMFQAGYRRMLGGDEIFDLFIEGGPTFNVTRYLRNQATINSLHVTLDNFYTQNYYPTYRAKYLNGFGMGAYAGFGLNINANAHWTVQLIYSPSFEKINIGEDPKFKLHHAAGIRAFYNL